MLDKSQAKFLMTQALIQVGVVAVLALSAFAISSCARKDTNPPLIALNVAVAKEGTQKSTVEDTGADSTSSTDLAPIKNGDKLLAQILKDKTVLAYLTSYKKKNDVTCTRPAAGQIHWDCKSSTACHFSLEITCVSNVTATGSNDEIRRLSILGEGNTAAMTYKISDPALTAAESKVQKIKFEYQR